MKKRKNSTPYQETKTSYFNIEDRFSKSHLKQFSIETRLAMQSALSAAWKIKSVDISSNIEHKEGIQNFATAWDLASEKTVMSSILKKFPADSVLSEESNPDLKNPLSNKRLWVIDPIDGTNNVARGIGYWAISVGFLKNGKPFSGAVYNPSRDELFYAEAGVGSFLNGLKIRISAVNDIENAAVNSDRSYVKSITDKHLDMLKKSGGLPQMKGSAVLTMAEIACGRYDLYFHTDIKPWDNAAAFALIENAGGTIRGIDGKKIDIMSKDVVAGNKLLVEEFIKRMSS